MARIKIHDLPKGVQIGGEEMKKINGSYITNFVIGVPDFVKADGVHSIARSQDHLLDSILSDVDSDIANGRVPL